MKTLIVEDDFTSRFVLQEILSPYGEVTIATNGTEAVDAVQIAYDNGAPYDLITLDIMMPEMDGQVALKKIRAIEDGLQIHPGHGVKVLMTTALNDKDNIFTAFREQCEGYLLKPITKNVLIDHLKELELI